MSQRFLQHKTTGNVIIWQNHLANDPDLVEVADANGTPMNVFEAEYTVVEEAPAPVKKAKAKKSAGLTVDDLDFDSDAALSVDASRGL